MKPWHDVRLLNTVANGLTALAAAALVSGGVWWLTQRPAFALRTVIVEPAVAGEQLSHVTSALLRTNGASRIDGNFFSVNLESVRDQFQAVPWVRRADVRRIWPDTLRVGIEEHRALAVWGDGQLVNQQGELFAANAAEADSDGELLEFSGPPGTEGLVMRRWKELNQQLAPLELAPVAVNLSNRYAWSARLDNGLTLLLGREQETSIAERVSRWVESYPQAQVKLNREVLAVDLRYPNGFAMRTPGSIDRKASDASSRSASTPLTTARGATDGAGQSTPRRTP